MSSAGTNRPSLEMFSSLSAIIAIYRKELRGYFLSPLSYAIAGIFWLLAGLFFYSILLGPEGVIAQAAFRDQAGITEPLDVPYETMRLFFGLLGSLALFVLPILSMGLYAEERKRGTLELLATSPIASWAVAVGKLLGVLTFFATISLPTLVYQAIAYAPASPAFPPTLLLLGWVALLLLAASILSLGMFVSSLTDSTLFAAVLTFALVLFLWIIDLVARSIGGVVGEALAYLSLLDRYETLIRGTIDTSSPIAFASYIFLGIFLTTQSIEALRFQRD